MGVVLLKQKVYDLKKKVNFSVKQHGLEDIKAQVVLVLDISKSMNKLYKSGVIQNVLESILPLSLNFDDDGKIDLILFGTRAYLLPPVSLEELDGYVQREIIENYKIIEATKYATALRFILDKYKGKQPDPVFVIFITDGNNSDKRESEEFMRLLSSEPVFFQFVGIGKEAFPFLKKLDELTGRLIDNAGFMHINDISTIDEGELYDRLLNEFPDWIKEAREKKII